jgi:hypothetical protein
MKYYINHDKYPDIVLRRKRCFYVVKTYSYAVFYSIFTVWNYFLLDKIELLPQTLGGQTDTYSYLEFLPRLPEDKCKMIRPLFYFQLGKILSKLFSHVFIRPEGTFYLYLLHHLIATILEVYSYLSNQWFLALYLLIIHDSSEVLSSISRALIVQSHLDRNIKANRKCLQLLYTYWGYSCGFLLGSMSTHWIVSSLLFVS